MHRLLFSKIEHLGEAMAKIGAATGGLAAGSIEVTEMLGYTFQEWQMLAVIIAAISGIGGLLLSLVFKTLHYRLERDRIRENRE